MNRYSLLLLIGIYSTVGFAYDEGRYVCKNKRAGLPDNIYVIKKILIESEGDKLPYIKATRFYEKNSGKQKSEIAKANVAGFATIFSDDSTSEILMIGAIKIEFVNGEMLGCVK